MSIMKQIIFLLVSLTIAHCFTISSDPEKTTVQDPPNSNTILQKNYSISDPMPYDANWIWTNGTSRSATFETLFYGRWVESANLMIRANNTYYAYMNGLIVKTGSKNTTDSTSINVQCGLNNFTVIVENNDTNATSSAVIFRIYANEAYIPTCTTNGFFNYSTCSCECSGEFECTSSQQKIGYPICGCKCANEAKCNSAGQFFDQKTCSCKCFPAYCRPNFQQDMSTCNCRCKETTCTSGKWNSTLCKCV
jgi:hypothetical protein